MSPVPGDKRHSDQARGHLLSETPSPLRNVVSKKPAFVSTHKLARGDGLCGWQGNLKKSKHPRHNEILLLVCCAVTEVARAEKTHQNTTLNYS
ncbi:unnamed protein product [Protopolystoma xenopodis]|uniref:Uncharacterized protein n=1 Tax=Protopolystoma xenopodis TaxID=117903 RepID=A0A448XLU8_9PLAT|nr:unnamed protein product [Protopolystoma xenopodis]